MIKQSSYDIMTTPKSNSSGYIGDIESPYILAREYKAHIEELESQNFGLKILVNNLEEKFNNLLKANNIEEAVRKEFIEQEKLVGKLKNEDFESVLLENERLKKELEEKKYNESSLLENKTEISVGNESLENNENDGAIDELKNKNIKLKEKINNLQDRNKALEEEKLENKKYIDELKESLDELNKRKEDFDFLDELMQNLENLTNRNEKLKEENDEMKSKILEYQQKEQDNNKLQEELKNANNLVFSQKEKIEKLQNAINTTFKTNEIDDAISKYKNLKTMNKELKNQIEKLNKDNNESKDLSKSQKLKEKIANLEKENNDYKLMVEGMENELKEVQKTNEILTNENNNLQQKINQDDSIIDKSESMINKSTFDTFTLSNETTDLLASQSFQNMSDENLAQTNKYSASEVTRLQDLNQKLQNKLQNSSILENENIKLVQENKKLQSDLKMLQNEIENNQKSLEEKEKLSEENEKLKEDIESLQNEIENNQKSLEEKEKLSEENEKLKEDIESLQNEIENNQASLEEKEKLSEENEKLKEDIQSLQNEMNLNQQKLLKENGKLKNDIKILQKKMKDNQTVLAKSQMLPQQISENETLDLSNSSNSINKSNNTSENKIVAKLLLKYKNLTNKNKILNEEKQNLLNEINKLQKSNENLRNKSKEILVENKKLVHTNESLENEKKLQLEQIKSFENNLKKQKDTNKDILKQNEKYKQALNKSIKTQKALMEGYHQLLELSIYQITLFVTKFSKKIDTFYKHINNLKHSILVFLREKAQFSLDSLRSDIVKFIKSTSKIMEDLHNGAKSCINITKYESDGEINRKVILSNEDKKNILLLQSRYFLCMKNEIRKSKCSDETFVLLQPSSFSTIKRKSGNNTINNYTESPKHNNSIKHVNDSCNKTINEFQNHDNFIYLQEFESFVKSILEIFNETKISKTISFNSYSSSLKETLQLIVQVIKKDYNKIIQSNNQQKNIHPNVVKLVSKFSENVNTYSERLHYEHMEFIDAIKKEC